MGSPYQAICKLLDPQGNHVFMHLEDPTHKELDEAHVRKKGFEKKYGNLLKVVEKKIRDKIKMIDGKSSKILNDSNNYHIRSDTLFSLIIETVLNYNFWPQKFILALKNCRK